MDLDQLKLLAGRVRGHLHRRGHDIGHNQSLDISAAIPGLRNWPEVMAFPARVAACEVDQAAIERLARRISRRFGAVCLPDELRLDLGGGGTPSALELWPGGPPAGIYVARSDASVLQLIERYDDATDGALFYSEELGQAHEAFFDLGETGVYGNGMSKLPSGSLVILSRVELTQETWEDARSRMQSACYLAYDRRLRVVVLPRVSSAATLYADLRLLVEENNDKYKDDDVSALRGYVSDAGELVPAEELFRPEAPQPTVSVIDEANAVIPPNMDEAIRFAVIEEPRGGIIVLGHLAGKERLAPILRAGLRATEYAGAACRVMSDPRELEKKRGPERRVVELPVVASVSAAIAQGYRRIVLEEAWGRVDEIVRPEEDVLFLVSTRAGEVMDVVTRSMRGPGDTIPWTRALTAVVTSVGGDIAPVGERWAIDGYVRGPDVDSIPDGKGDYAELTKYFRSRRFHRIEDDLRFLADNCEMTKAEFINAMPGIRNMEGALKGATFPYAKRLAARKGKKA